MQARTYPTLSEVEKRFILATLKKTGGNRTHAAKLLGISIRTMRNKLKEYREAEEASLKNTTAA